MNRVTTVLHTEYCSVQSQCYHSHRKLTCNPVQTCRILFLRFMHVRSWS